MTEATTLPAERKGVSYANVSMEQAGGGGHAAAQVAGRRRGLRQVMAAPTSRCPSTFGATTGPASRWPCRRCAGRWTPSRWPTSPTRERPAGLRGAVGGLGGPHPRAHQAPARLHLRRRGGHPPLHRSPSRCWTARPRSTRARPSARSPRRTRRCGSPTRTSSSATSRSAAGRGATRPRGDPGRLHARRGGDLPRCDPATPWPPRWTRPTRRRPR
jgi:hypothetical protein